MMERGTCSQKNCAGSGQSGSPHQRARSLPAPHCFNGLRVDSTKQVDNKVHGMCLLAAGAL